MKKQFHDKITLGLGQSLIMGNNPEKIDLEKFGTNPDKDVSAFGLFETATPNFHTYYPEVTSDDLAPKDGEFIKPIFRALSMVIVHKSRNPIDFSKNGVLKASMNKLVGQTIYANHESMVGNEVGAVSKVFWQNQYTTSSGIVVPAGINAEFTIDGKAHPNIARKILMSPPAIHSNSVTVEFIWEPSHPNMDMNEFRSKLGSVASDGKLIRRVVTEVARYHETSLVSHGADPFAQVIKDNKIVNPEYADSVYSLSMQGKEKPNKFFFSYKEGEETISLSEDTTLNNPNNNNQNTDMKQLIALLALKFAVAEDLVTESFIIEKFNSLNDNAALLQAEKDKVTNLTTELATEKQKVVDLTVNSEIGKNSLTALRTETTRLYNLLKGDKADATVLTVIEKADYNTLAAFEKDYKAQTELMFPITCQDCKSSNVSRNTATPAAAPGAGNPEGGNKNKSNDELAQEFRDSANKTVFVAEKESK